MWKRIWQTFSFLEYVLVEVSRSIWILRAPIFVSALSFWLLSQDQIQEVYTSLAYDDAKRWPIIWAALSLATLCGFLFLIARELTLTRAPEARSQETTHGFTLRNFPGLLGIIPLFGAAYGLYQASRPLYKYVDYRDLVPGQLGNCEAGHLSETKCFLWELGQATARSTSLFHWLNTSFYICSVLGIAAALLILLRGNRRSEFLDAITANVFGRSFLVLFLSLLAFCIIIIVKQTDQSFGPDIMRSIRELGAIFITNLFLIFLAFFSASFVLWYDRRGIPVVTLLVGLALLCSYRDWNDNHDVRLIKGQDLTQTGDATTSPPWAAEIPLLPLAFMDWFDHRPEQRKCRFSAQGCSAGASEAQEKGKPPRPYPVYIVAAEGGGLYAAELIATVLARLYDRCPALRHHIFALSGVSGGSLGAGLIAALLKDGSAAQPSPLGDPSTCDQQFLKDNFAGPLEKKVNHFLSDDFLSPSGAAGLFPDFLQRFVPYPIPLFDRAGAFEASLEQSWESSKIGSGPHNPLRESFRSHWQADGNVPMLVLNTTRVESGQPIVVAPFLTWTMIGLEYGGELTSIYEQFVREKVDRDIPLSTAIVLSARFPLVMPAGAVLHHNYRLADGGYFENSGVDTALLMIRDLQFFLNNANVLPKKYSEKSKAYENIEFRLLVLNEWSEKDWTKKAPAEPLNELLTPVRALYRARVQRGQIAISRAQSLGIKTRVMRLDHGFFNMPLGWQLSGQTNRMISTQIGYPELCEYQALAKDECGKAKTDNKPTIEKIENEYPGKQKIENEMTCLLKDKKNLIEPMTTLFLLRFDNACAMREILRDVSLSGVPAKKAAQ